MDQGLVGVVVETPEEEGEAVKLTEPQLDRLVRLWEMRKPMTQTEIANLFGVSRHKIQTIERRAIQKIKEAMETAK